MTKVKKFWPILTGTHRYEKTLSTRKRGQVTIIGAPILAYLKKMPDGRILCDVVCNYNKINNSDLKRTLSHTLRAEAA